MHCIRNKISCGKNNEGASFCSIIIKKYTINSLFVLNVACCHSDVSPMLNKKKNIITEITHFIKKTIKIVPLECPN
jgi:dihydroorotate dehydrogenase